MLQYYILMKMKNKMKDFEAKFEEWWEVVKEYFTKELENNLIQHRARMKGHKQGQVETDRQEEMQIEEPHDFKSGTIQEEEVQLEKPHDLKGRGHEEKEPQRIQEQEKVEVIPILQEKESKIQHLEIEPQTKLVGEDTRITELEVDIEPLVLIHVEIIELQQGRQMFKRI